MPYQITLDTPKPFWDEAHRPAAFINFSASEGDDDADVEDSLA